MPEMQPERPPGVQYTPAHDGGSAIWSLVAALLFLYVGFGLGLVGVSGNAIYDGSVTALVWGARIVGIGLLVVAGLDLAKVGFAAALDAMLAGVATVLCLGVGAVWLVYGDMQGVLLIIFGIVNGSSARNAWSRWSAWLKPRAASRRDPMTTNSADNLARYARQMCFAPIGADGQRRLLASRVTLIGCGALGSVLANTLVRGGVGFLRIVDRDFVELDNLQRQVLFDEDDAAGNLPKAEAAARKLRRINSGVTVEPIIADANPANIERFCQGAHLILDGTDNFETRYLVNDVAVKHEIPWIYGACIASEGRVMPIVPGRTACLRCVWPDAPPPGSTETCESAGVLASIVNVVASLEAAEALKILSGRTDALNRKLVSVDVWSGRWHAMDIAREGAGDACPCCGAGEYAFLQGGQVSTSAILCGRNAVQVMPPATVQVDFEALAGRLGSAPSPAFNNFLLRFRVDECEVTLFRDGRAIIKGTSDIATARAIYARYIGT